MLRTILGCALGLGLLVGTTAGTPVGPEVAAAPTAAAPERPNVVVVLMDDMRRDDLAWMPKVVQRIGGRGTTYTRYYTPLSLCCPARAALLRGQYPHNTGVLTNAEPDGGFAGFSKVDSSTLATWLDPYYETAYVGKYFNGYEGRAQRYVPPGWDEWLGTIRTYDYRGTITNKNGRPVVNQGTNSPQVFANQAGRFLSQRTRSSTPFFLYLSFVTPHSGSPRYDGDHGVATPFVPRRDRGTYDGPVHARHNGYNEEKVGDKTGPIAGKPRLTKREKRYVAIANQQRREALASADRAIDQVLTKLRRTGALEDTYVVFTSDNGFLLGEHRFIKGKRQPYEESSHLPLLIRGPGVPVDARWNGLAGTPDLARTILRMAGLSPRHVARGVTLDGTSIMPVRSRIDAARRRAILLERAGLPTDAENGGSVRFAAPRPVVDTKFAYRAVVTKRWKLIEWYPDRDHRSWEMYDLKADPYETRNVYGQDGTAKRARILKRRLDALWMCSGRQCKR